MISLKAISSAALLVILGFCSSAMGQSPRIGKTLDEITQLANKEGQVRVAASWEPQNEQQFLKGFNQSIQRSKSKLIVWAASIPGNAS